MKSNEALFKKFGYVRFILILLSMLAPYLKLYAQSECLVGSYFWPVGDGDTQQRINGTFMEYRSSNPPIHFHDGIDIDAENGTVVYSCAYDMKVVDISGPANDKIVRLDEQVSPYRIFYYIHLGTVAVEEDQIVDATDAIGTANSQDHLHFNEGPDGLEVNPLRDENDALCPFIDSANPEVLGYGVYFDNTNNQVPKINNIYQISGRVDFQVQARDVISGPGGGNVSVYGIEYDVYNQSGARVGGNSFIFDYWLPEFYVAFVYNTNLSTNSIYWYIPSNNLTSNWYWDSNTVPDGSYNLQITVFDTRFNSDIEEYSIDVNNTTAVADRKTLLPIEYELWQNFPNPFNPSTTIRFAVPQKSLVSLAIYDERGGLVRELASDKLYQPGWNEVLWDGTNAAGLPVSSGVYFYRMRAQGLHDKRSFMQTRKLTLLK